MVERHIVTIDQGAAASAAICSVCGCPLIIIVKTDLGSYCRCTDCRTYQVQPLTSFCNLDLDELNTTDWYSSLAGSAIPPFDAADFEKDRQYHRHRVKELGRLAGPGKLLEVGCGTGYFLSLAREAGWEVKGLEPSTKVARGFIEPVLMASEALTTTAICGLCGHPLDQMQPPSQFRHLDLDELSIADDHTSRAEVERMSSKQTGCD